MATDGKAFSGWLREAKISERKLTPEQIAVLQSAHCFRVRCGSDYYSQRFLTHYLLHCDTGLKVAQIARLAGVSRPTASEQQGLSSKQVIQTAHHRMAGRHHGKLLPRYAGSIAQFMVKHPEATRLDILDFIERVWKVRVSTVALFHFMKKYGLDKAQQSLAAESEEPPVIEVASPRVGRVAGGDPAAVEGFFFTHTQYAGAFLLLPTALNWLTTAQDCFQDLYGSLRRGLLTSVFCPLVGVSRIFHLDQMEDMGFALLTGGRRCPSRYTVGAWRRNLPWYEVDRFCRLTSPWHWIEGEDAVVSFDEHSIPRWTHKFSVSKGFVTIRNKYMRCEKLYHPYDVLHDRFLGALATPGNVELRDVSLRLIRQVLAGGRPHSLHALFDAGAGKADADVRELMDLAGQTSRLDVTVRAVRHPTRVQIWKSLAAEEFVSYEEDGPSVGAPPKEIRLAETVTTLKDESPDQAVRTIVCRELVPGPRKDRWHPLYTSSDEQPLEVLQTFRTRQHHEQGYRVSVHDENLNAVPCAYDKTSPDRCRPRFHRGPLQMIGWLAALLYNAVADLAVELPQRYQGAHVATLRRTFFNRPGDIYVTPNAVIVNLDPFSDQQDLIPLVDSVNKQACHVPWLDGRRLVMSLSPPATRGHGP